MSWIRRPFEFLDECAARYGEVFRLQLLGVGNVAVMSSPELVKEVFAGSPDTFHGGEANQALRPFVGAHSLLVLDGPEHLRQRKLLMPAFHGERMHAYGQTMLDFSDQAVDQFPLGERFPLHPAMQAVTLRVILRTILGVAAGERFESAITFIREGVELASNPLLLFPLFQRELFGLSPWGKFMRLSRQLDELLRGEVDRRQATGLDERQTDILTMLLAARDEQGQPMTFQELRDEMVTMLVAGHETTATALGWTMAWLLPQPALCQRLRDELAGAVENGRLVAERVAKLPLLDATVREGLRVRPVAPLVGRILKQAVKFGPYELPAGWMVTPCIYLAQRRPEVFPEPDRFDPDRFLRARISPNEAFPFGGGNRRCIGVAFATYEMKMVLATLLWRTELQLAPGYTPSAVRRGVTMAPSDGVPVVLDQRRPIAAA